MVISLKNRGWLIIPRWQAKKNKTWTLSKRKKGKKQKKKTH